MDTEKAEEIEAIIDVLKRRCQLVQRDLECMKSLLNKKDLHYLLSSLSLSQSSMTIMVTGLHSILSKTLWIFEEESVESYQKNKYLSNAKNSEFMLSGCVEAWRAYNKRISELIK